MFESNGETVVVLLPILVVVPTVICRRIGGKGGGW